MRERQLLAGLALVLVGCERSTPPSTMGGAVDATNAAVPSVPAAVSVSPSFRAQIAPFLAKNCASADGCHGAHPTDSVDLDLRVGAAHGELVNREALARRGAMRVKPGDAIASFLVTKLTGKLGAKEGKAMPLDVDTGAPVTLTAEQRAFVRDVLEPWIRGGARED